MKSIRGLVFGSALCLAGMPVSHAEPTGDGLYAGFITTAGDFWCRLEYQRVPRTVASFVGLAEGTRSWIDFPRAAIVRGPFYNGLTFHRVVEHFVIQAGSPNGQGTDGPGYMFADEFDDALRHSKAGILSMANSGPDSNGSQFFITVTNTPWLDGLHSVFGEVVEGLSNVIAISRVPTNATSHPLTPVVIEEVRIVRNGADAEAFDPDGVQPPLPSLESVPASVRIESDRLDLLLQPATNRLLYLFASTNLGSWSHGSSRQTITNVDTTKFLGAPYTNFPSVFFKALEAGIDP